MSPRIAVIGAGPCGITIAKNLLQAGLNDFTVFEKNHVLGGNWVYSETDTHSSIYETTHIISSKRLSQYEDFPMPAHYPDYPSHKQLLQYFNDYAHHFGVISHIQFNTTVTKVDHMPDNRWHVWFCDEQGSHEAYFDELFIANGHHWDPVWPQYPGQFSGQIMHAHQYKKSSPFRGQRVLVVGAGNSACDVAVEIARVAEKVAISIRQGQHILPKFIFGKPTDVAFHKVRWMPRWIKTRFARAMIRMLQGRYAKYQLTEPLHDPLAKHPTINSEMLYFIRHGKIHPLPALQSFDGEQVLFANGHREVFDVVVFATGYHVSFPFFAKDFIDYREKTQIALYHHMMHPQYDHLYFIGLFQPQGCIWPLADHQAKLAAAYIKDSLKKPKDLEKQTNKALQRRKKHFHMSARHALEVDYHVFRSQLLKALSKTQ